MGVHENREGERHQAELQECGGLRQIHQRPAAHRRSDQRHRALYQGYEQGEDEREMADLYEHAASLARQIFPAAQGKLANPPSKSPGFSEEIIFYQSFVSPNSRTTGRE